MTDNRDISLVLSGGIALGSYQAGAWQALQGDRSTRVGWIAGSSIGAINGALIAGNAPERRAEILEQYWLRRAGQDAHLLQAMGAGFRHVANWMSVAQARLVGSPRHFVAAGPRLRFSSFYDLAPTRAFLREHVDFDRLNGGEIRFTVCTTDIESGEPVHFDTAKGDRVGIDHILASCGFLPEFEPVEIGGRLLGDGGLVANAPVEPVLDALEGTQGTVIVLDLFARHGRRPTGLQSALARKNGLVFGNQTYARLDLYRRLWQRLGGTVHPTILYLSYDPVAEEAGAEMPFDFSVATARDRWHAGMDDMREALRRRGESRTTDAILLPIRRAAIDAPPVPAQ